MVCDNRVPNQIRAAQHAGIMQVRMCAAVVTMTSFCFEAGKGEQGVCNKSLGAVEHGRWVPTMTEEGLFEGLPCPCLGSLDSLHHAGCSWQTAVCKQRLPFRPGQMRVLQMTIHIYAKQNEVTASLGVSAPCSQAAI